MSVWEVDGSEGHCSLYFTEGQLCQAQGPLRHLRSELGNKQDRTQEVGVGGMRRENGDPR